MDSVRGCEGEGHLCCPDSRFSVKSSLIFEAALPGGGCGHHPAEREGGGAEGHYTALEV